MPGPFYCVNDVSVYLGRQRGGGVPDCIERTSLRPYLVVSAPGLPQMYNGYTALGIEVLWK